MITQMVNGEMQWGLVMTEGTEGQRFRICVVWESSPGLVEAAWLEHLANKLEGSCPHTRICDDAEAQAYLLAQRLEGDSE